MTILRRLLRLDDPDHDRIVAEKEKIIETQRQEYRQTVQRAESGVRILNTWDGAMRMLRENE